MKIRHFQFQIIVFLLVIVSNMLIAKTTASKTTSTVDAGTTYLDYIKTCRWKNDARSCVVFTFYDNCPSHKKISEVFDNYNFKSTFFVVSDNMLVDSLTTMLVRGHEIGNHTRSHPYLASLDSLHLENEIKDAKIKIESCFGIHCLSFSEPFSSRSPLSLNIARKYHSFIRAYNKYPENEHLIYTISPSASIKELERNLKNSIKIASVLEIEGHGMDGDGYEPITKQLLVQFLDTIQAHVSKDDCWITTYTQSGCYENLYHEVKINSQQKGDTVIVKFINYNIEDYKYIDSLPISIEIPYYLSTTMTLISNDVEVSKKNDKFVATVDLKKRSEISFVLKGLYNRFNTHPNFLITTNFVYPNPVKEMLNLRCVGKVQWVKIFTNTGNQILDIPFNTNKINVSHLPNDSYFISVFSTNGAMNFEYKNKFIKID